MAKKSLYAVSFAKNRLLCVSVFFLTFFLAFLIGEPALHAQCAVPPAGPAALMISTGATATFSPSEGDTGLVAHWKFDEGSGTIACDFSGNGNTGTLLNGPQWTAGKVGNALYFDGLDDNVVAAASGSLGFSGSFTLSAWVNPASTATNYRSILVKNYTYYLYASVAGYCGNGNPLGGFKDGTAKTVCQPSPLSINAWTHMALTYNGSTLMLYRDGVAVSNLNISGSLSPGTGTLQIAASQFGEYFHGTIDEVRIYSRALSLTEIQTIYQQDVANAPQTVATPVISPNGGTYSGSTSVTMQAATSGSSIYYTLDGSTPTQASILYSGSVTLTSSATVKAKAFKSGYNASAEASASFTIAQAPPTTGKVYYVGKTGSNNNACSQAQNPNTPKQTITGSSGGISCLSSGDTLIIKAGVYNEAYYNLGSGQPNIPGGTGPSNMTVIKGEGIGVTIWKPTDGYGILMKNSNNYIRWQGFTLDCIVMKNATDTCFKESRQDTGLTVGWHIADLAILDAPASAMYFHLTSRNWTVERNEMRNHGRVSRSTQPTAGYLAIYGQGSGHIVRNNHAYLTPEHSPGTNGGGIRVASNAVGDSGPGGSIIESNVIQNLRIGIISGSNDNNIVRDNSIIDTTLYGIQTFMYPSETQIYNNTIGGKCSIGILVGSTAVNTSVTNNTISGCSVPISDSGLGTIQSQ